MITASQGDFFSHSKFWVSLAVAAFLVYIEARAGKFGDATSGEARSRRFPLFLLFLLDSAALRPHWPHEGTTPRQRASDSGAARAGVAETGAAAPGRAL